MKVYEVSSDRGEAFAIEVEVPLRGRRRVCSILLGIEDVHITRMPRLLSWVREENFCEFEIGGVSFSVEEQFGDNSRYWIGPDDGEAHAELQLLSDAFSKAGRW
jgi:hypothetical protein